MGDSETVGPMTILEMIDEEMKRLHNCLTPYNGSSYTSKESEWARSRLEALQDALIKTLGRTDFINTNEIYG